MYHTSKQTRTMTKQISELVFEEIETNLSHSMTYKQEDSNFIFFAYKANYIPDTDMDIVNSVCKSNEIKYDIVQTPKGKAFKIHLHN